MHNFTRDQIIQKAIALLKTNIISPNDPENKLNWTERKGPWGKKINNLLIPPEAGDFITPNKNTFVGQWYWDSMAINVGSLRSSDIQLKKVSHSMVRNLFMLYEKTGLIPNAADSVQHTRSQPPFLTSMCVDIADNFFSPGDINGLMNWYLSAYEYCKREIESPWEANATDFGFHWFDNIKKKNPGYSEEETLSYFRPESRSDFRILRSVVYKVLSSDLREIVKQGYKKTESHILKALASLDIQQRKELCKWLYSRRLLVCSGMDFTSSYGLKKLPARLKEILEPGMLSASDQVYSTIDEISPLDLNCLMYKYYTDLSWLAEQLHKWAQPVYKDFYKKEIEKWTKKSTKQRELIYNLHYSKEKSCFFNYNIRTGKMYDHPHITHSIYPLFVKLADERNAPELVRKIMNLTTDYGIKFTQKKTGFQWDYNMWPLQTWLCVQGLLNYGYITEANKIAHGYIRCVEKVFNSEETFFEKYNAENGNTDTDGRYPSEPEFSWGAAVYIALVRIRALL